MNIWGITGTNGKTTTTWILAAFIESDRRRKCGYITTVEVFDGARHFYTGYTTPPLKQLKQIFADMEANGCTDCVMEVSSHAIHQHRTGDTVFAGGGFTNLSEDHLDYHKTMEEYFRVKLSFAEQIANDRFGGQIPDPQLGRKDFPPYVVCMDGGYGKEMFNACGNLPLNVIPVTCKNPQFDLSRLQLVGEYNQSNVLVAAALALASGIGKDLIQATIPALKPRWGRLELVECESMAKVYVDFAHTPDGLEKVLTAARAFTRGKLWVVFGAGGDRDPMKRPLMGEAAARLADRVVVTSDNPRSERPEDIIAAIVEKLDNRPVIEPDRRKAIHYALANAGADDVVIIAGKGHETTQEIAGVKYPFDDREVAREYKRIMKNEKQGEGLTSQASSPINGMLGDWAEKCALARGHHISDKTKRSCLELFEKGFGYKKSARMLGLRRYTVRDWRRSYKQGDISWSIGKKGRKRVVRPPSKATEVKEAHDKEILPRQNAELTEPQSGR